MDRIMNPKSSDLDVVFQFMIACDIEEYGEGDSSREDLEEQWSDIDLSQDAWVARDEMANLVGYACVSGEGSHFNMDLYIHGRYTPQGLEDELMQRCISRTEEKSNPPKDKVNLRGYATGMNMRLQEVYERFGFTRHTYHYRMQIDFDRPTAPVEWPQTMHTSAYEEKDEAELYHLINNAFTWRGREIPALDAWRSLLFRGGRYDPQYMVLLREAGKLIGAALCYAEETGGWIRQLAVAPEYQGKGLGGLLLRHMFWAFSNIGMKSVGLSVASANENAFCFYERNGMKKTREFIEYRRTL